VVRNVHEKIWRETYRGNGSGQRSAPTRHPLSEVLAIVIGIIDAVADVIVTIVASHVRDMVMAAVEGHDSRDWFVSVWLSQMIVNYITSLRDIQRPPLTPFPSHSKSLGRINDSF
jgi:hypothetical protein